MHKYLLGVSLSFEPDRICPALLYSPLHES